MSDPKVEPLTFEEEVKLTKFRDDGTMLRPFRDTAGEIRYAPVPEPLEDGIPCVTTESIDESAYVPAKKLLGGRFRHYTQIKRVLKKNPQIRSHKPTSQRLSIHLGDWRQYLVEQGHGDSEIFDSLTDEQIDAALAGLNKRTQDVHKKKANT